MVADIDDFRRRKNRSALMFAERALEDATAAYTTEPDGELASAIAQLRPQLPEGVAHSHDASRNQLYLLEQWGYVSSQCQSSRRGLTVGDGRSRLYRITPAGRLALEDVAAQPATPTTGDH